MRFEWDPAKANENERKHGVTFHEAQQLFQSDGYLELRDEHHSAFEERFIAIGPIERGIITTVFTERDDDIIRIISARMATKREIRLFQAFMGGKP